MSPTPDHQRHVEAFREGSQEALGVLYSAHGPRVRNYLWLLMGDPDMADDLTHEVFMMAWRDRLQLREADRFVPWVMSIARHAGYAELRRGRRASMISLDSPVNDDSEATPADEYGFAGEVPSVAAERLQERHRREIIRQILPALRPYEREIIIMTYFMGLKQREIADILGLTVGSIGTMLRRALNKLRKALKDHGHRPEDLI